MEQNRFEDLARRLFESLPPSIRAVQKDVEANFRSVLRSGLARLDMVTRDEFDAQSRVLERSRELIESLGKRVAELESRQAAAMMATATAATESIAPAMASTTATSATPSPQPAPTPDA